ncbi:50S ribosomal protein L32e [Candidatus Micrarchaeota archaeon]|nr:50S ribosomal protein L32e [Candidatus Micrarchaeota archaeon]
MKKDYSKTKKLPKFKRNNYESMVRLRTGWRKPRGIDSKQRIFKGGSGASPRIGYGTKAEERNLHPSGLKELIVNTVEELKNAKNVAVRIAKTVGNKKKLTIVAEAKKLGLKVLNPKTFKKEKKEVKKEEKKTEAKEEKKEAKKEPVKEVKKEEKKTEKK